MITQRVKESTQLDKKEVAPKVYKVRVHAAGQEGQVSLIKVRLCQGTLLGHRVYGDPWQAFKMEKRSETTENKNQERGLQNHSTLYCNGLLA